MSIAEDYADFISLWDTTGDWQEFCTAIGTMFAEVETYAADTDTQVGWQPLWDVNLCPHNALPWLCMVMGETAPSGATDDQLRALITAAPNQKRGSPQGLADSIKQVLTGAQTVGLKERDTGSGSDDDAISIVTWTSETPDQNAVLAAIRRNLPADIIPTYQCLDGESYTALMGGNTYADVEALGPTYAEIEASSVLSGYTLY